MTNHGVCVGVRVILRTRNPHGPTIGLDTICGPSADLHFVGPCADSLFFNTLWTRSAPAHTMRAMRAMLLLTAAAAAAAAATCADTDGTATDKDAYGCSSYTINGCYGDYDDDDFSSMTMCCVCGGGATPSAAATADSSPSLSPPSQAPSPSPSSQSQALSPPPPPPPPPSPVAAAAAVSTPYAASYSVAAAIAPPSPRPPPPPPPPPVPPATPGGGSFLASELKPGEWADRFAWENQNGRKMTNWHTKLHEHLIGSGSGYDLNSPPISDRSKYSDPNGTSFSLAAQTSDAGTDVQLQLRVLKLDEIDITGGGMTVKVWIRMQWQDDRLKWDPTKCEPRHKPTTL